MTPQVILKQLTDALILVLNEKHSELYQEAMDLVSIDPIILERVLTIFEVSVKSIVIETSKIILKRVDTEGAPEYGAVRNNLGREK